MNDKKLIFKKFISILVLLIVFYLLQTAVFSNFEIAGIVPNFMIILVSFFGFMHGKRDGMFVGFLTGVLLDVTTGGLFCEYALILLYIGYFNGLMRQFFYGDDIKLPLLFVAISDLMYGFCVYMISFFPRQKYDIGYYFNNVMMPEVMYTVLLAIVLYVPFVQMISWIDKQDKRSTRTIV